MMKLSVHTTPSSADYISGVLKGKVSEDIDRYSILEVRLMRYEITLGTPEEITAQCKE